MERKWFEVVGSKAERIGANLDLDDKWVIYNLPVALNETRLVGWACCEGCKFARCNTLDEVIEVLSAVYDKLGLNIDEGGWE